MKIIYFLVFLSLAVLSSCSKNESPKIVAEKFLNAMQRYDFKEATNYSTVETKKLLQQLEKLNSLQNADVKNEVQKITIVSEDIKSKSAIVYYRLPGDENDQKISLVVVPSDEDDLTSEKVWKVDLKKEEIEFLRPQEILMNPSSEKIPS
jgi:hypothetical protein